MSGNKALALRMESEERYVLGGPMLGRRGVLWKPLPIPH